MIDKLRQFFHDYKQYRAYVIEKAKTDLKVDVAGSHLGCLWLILDPLFFMLVYTFVSSIVFKTSEPYFSAFIFIGCTTFKLFDKTIKRSIKIIASNRNIVKNVYIPKPAMLMSSMYINLFESCISFILVFISMALYKVPLTWHIFQFIPLVILLILLCYGFGLIFMHCGVFVEDLFNVATIALNLMSYFSGVFFSIPNRISNKLLQNLLLRVNPIAFIIEQMRGSLLYGRNMEISTFVVWFIISLFINAFGICLVYKNENSYVKML